jgi:hypothetical protein
MRNLYDFYAFLEFNNFLDIIHISVVCDSLNLFGMTHALFYPSTGTPRIHRSGSPVIVLNILLCAGPVTAFIGPGVGPGAQREAAGGQGPRTGPS